MSISETITIYAALQMCNKDRVVPELCVLHSEMHSALLGAIHGLEQHIQDLFAQWNRGDLSKAR